MRVAIGMLSKPQRAGGGGGADGQGGDAGGSPHVYEDVGEVDTCPRRRTRHLCTSMWARLQRGRPGCI